MTTTEVTPNDHDAAAAAAISNKKIVVAIVGSGVAGLAAAWHLHQNCGDRYEVHIFEAEDRLGGHACTTTVTTAKNQDVDVDIGFMVFNHSNYPNMVKWFQAMGVAEEDSDMSLSVSLDQGRSVEWNSDGLNGLFAKRSQIVSPSFYRYVRDMLRFNDQATSSLLHLPTDDPRRAVTTAQYLREHGYSSAFGMYYLLPMMAALWSASIDDVLQFPAEQLVAFLANHKMLQLFERPQWKTVAGRSKKYTENMRNLLGDRAHLSTPIVAVIEKKQGQYELHTAPTSTDEATTPAVDILFDQVIFACHPPTASAMLQKGGRLNVEDELAKCLSRIHYADNVVYVHSDPSLMPQRRRAWASWNCLGQSQLLFNATRQLVNHKAQREAFEGGASGFGNKIHQNGSSANHENGISNGVHNGSSGGHETDQQLEGKDGRMRAVYVTYWLNRLQNLQTDQDIFVSLNPHHRPAPELTHQRRIMGHPQFTPATLTARNALLQYQGQGGLWFCGAWQGYGFHEDGCRSGFDVATQLSGTPLPWCNDITQGSTDTDKSLMVLPPPDLSKSQENFGLSSIIRYLYKKLSYNLPVAVCKPWILHFLKQAVQRGQLRLKSNDGTILSFGDGSQANDICDASPVTIRIFDDWFYVKTALEYDLGLARSYMAGYFVVEPLGDANLYDSVVRPLNTNDESTNVLGDPVGLVRLFLLLIANRDHPDHHRPRKAGRGHWYNNALTNASGLVVSRIGALLNFLRYKLTMDNSENGGSLKNIHSHYDLSNDLFTTFLDKETLMYSSAIYDAVQAPVGKSGLVFRGTLEQAQWRKLDTLLHRAQVQPGQTLLDIGFGWGGLSIHAAQKYGCHVTGITLSVEQKALAEKRVKEEGLEHLITFEVVDYRTFARRHENRGRFDRVLSCEMIEAVGHEHLGEFFWAVEQVLKHNGILVMEAITTPEQRYETYRRSTDFINTIIFPGSCCPSLHALVDAAYQNSCLTLEHVDNIGLHYARTLAEWRRRFNANEDVVRKLGFDDVFLRVWNYYFAYCEAGFHSQTENCLVLVFARQGCGALTPLCETRSVIQAPALTDVEIQNWLTEVP